MEFTFVHAADLHLGAPFRGLDAAASGAFANGRSGGDPLAGAGFAALDRLEELCLAAGAAFLILAGDIYDDADGVLKARFALRDMFLRLERAGITVFIAHGNHDPLTQGPLPVAWPGNVVVFGSEPRAVAVMRDGTPLAVVQGVSHASPREKDNLALRFDPALPAALAGEGDAVSANTGSLASAFRIAVLHCNVGGAGDGHAPYAPCALSDLTGAGFDYWALGHVHQGKILHAAPHVVYPGSLQGLHINETGPHGCCVVRVEDGECTVTPVPLAPVEWRKIRIDCAAPGTEDENDSVDALAGRILGVLTEAAAEAGEAAGRSRPEALFCRVILEGHTALDAALRKPGGVGALLERLRKELEADDAPVAVRLKDIVPETAPARDFGALAERNDLVGEVVRLANAATSDEDFAASLAAPLESLYGHHKLKKALGRENLPDPAALAGSAKSLLCSLLEDG